MGPKVGPSAGTALIMSVMQPRQYRIPLLIISLGVALIVLGVLRYQGVLTSSFYVPISVAISVAIIIAGVAQLALLMRNGNAN